MDKDFYLPSFSLDGIFGAKVLMTIEGIIMNSIDGPSVVVFALQNCKIRLQISWHFASPEP